MELIERTTQPRTAPPTGPGASDNLDALSAATERMIAAGDDAVERALSGNSEDFLRSTRQTGGE
jgi:hypothetical protein